MITSLLGFKRLSLEVFTDLCVKYLSFTSVLILNLNSFTFELQFHSLETNFYLINFMFFQNDAFKAVKKADVTHFNRISK